MKLKTTHAMALCALALLGTQPAWAAVQKGPSADLRIEGAITPGSCEIILGNDGKFNYQSIPQTKIKDVAEGTYLGGKDLTLTVQCEEVTQVGLNLTDNKHDSVVSGLTVSGNKSNTNDYLGLGKSHGKNIGASAIWVDRAMVDSKDSYVGYLDLTTSSISPEEGDWLWRDRYGVANKLLTWVQSSATTPTPGKTFTSRLRAHATINKKSELDLSDEVKLDGAATLTVYYL